MLRSIAALFVVAATMANSLPCQAESPTASPPSLYEIQINGESFLVEANRQIKLESKAKPGVSYNVAVRIAPTQRVRLNAIQFDYDLPAKVEADNRGENRSARLTHELGFSVLLCDLGHPLDAKNQEEALKILLKSVTTTLRAAKTEGIEVSEPHQRSFDGSSARGATIRYRDAKDIGHVYLVYVLTGPNHAATCVAEYLENDSDDVLPLVKKTLDSVRPIDRQR
jgi:hypothetical protein